MTDKPIVPKSDQNRKHKSGSRPFTEEEFEGCLARLIEEDRECCSL
jgi:hypothetical protein